MNKKSILYLLTAVILFVGCSDSGSDPDPLTNASVYVTNEGNFGDKDGSVSGYDFETSTSIKDITLSLTQERFAGIIQEATVIDDKLYLTVNDPDQIKVYDLQTFTPVDTLALSFTPLGIAEANDGQAYVTDLFNGNVVQVNLEPLEETNNTIAVGQSPRYVFTDEGKAYVSNNAFGTNGSISIIDINSGAVETTIEVGPGPDQIIKGPSGLLWVICSGASAYDEDNNRDPENDTPGGIFIIDPDQQAVVNTIETGGRPTSIAVDDETNEAYISYLAKDVLKIDMNTQQVVDSSFIDRPFEAIAFSESEQMIYGGVSNGYVQDGKAILYGIDGLAVDSFTVGKHPTEFIFKND